MSKSKTSRASSNRPPAIFPPPGHDHDRCSSDAMAVAEALCAQRSQRLTPIRRKVLAALLGSHKPLGAYEIIDRLALKGPRLAPIAGDRAHRHLHALPAAGNTPIRGDNPVSLPSVAVHEVRIIFAASPKCGLLNQSHTRSISCECPSIPKFANE